MQYALHGTAINPDTGKVANYYELTQCNDGHLWAEANNEEIGFLAQGLGPNSKIPIGTNMLFFIPIQQLFKDCKATYLHVVCTDCPKKPQPCHVCWTVGGNCVQYPGDMSTKMADITTAKILFNSVLSTPSTKFMTINLKDFYLGTPIECYKYIFMPIKMLLPKIINLYALKPLFHNGYVYTKI